MDFKGYLKEEMNEGALDKHKKAVFKIMADLLNGKGMGFRDVYKYLSKEIKNGNLSTAQANGILEKLRVKVGTWKDGSINLGKTLQEEDGE